VGICASIASFLVGEHVVPWSQREFQKTQAAMFGYAVAASPNLASNRVFVYENYNFYIGSATKDARQADVFHLQKVLIIENPTDPNNFPRFFTANTAEYKDGLWTLYDVTVHSEDSNGFTTVEMHPARMTLDLRIPLPTIGDDANGLANQPEAFTMAQLQQKIAVMKKTGLESREYEVAYYFKVALPFLCLAFAICAPPLSMKFARTGSFVGIFLSIVMVFVAWNTLILAKALGIHGYLPPFLSAWAANILFCGLGLYFLWRME
jgi:lipopolysaccharide export system permease protein